MPVPWLAVGKIVLGNLDTIIGVVKPAFTRKPADAAPTHTELLNQQIAELQAACARNAEQIQTLAADLKQVVTALDEAALKLAAARSQARVLSIVAIAASMAALIAVSVTMLA